VSYTPPAAAAGPPPGTFPTAEPAEARCPLCGAGLHGEQEWCLRCGAAARTRLAAAPNWRAPLVTLTVIGVLALGVLAAALVKLAGDSGPAPAPRTITVTRPAPPAASAPAATVPPVTATRPGAGTIVTGPARAGTAAGPATRGTGGAARGPGALKPSRKGSPSR